MPQTFQVLRCYKCAVFQVHPTKKSNKWKCKMCGEKQSMKRFYGLGTGQECRLHVQKLNSIRGDIQNINCESKDSDESESSEKSSKKAPAQHAVTKKSKWQDYLDKENENNEQQDPSPGETEIILEKPKKRPRKIINEVNETSLLSKKVNCLTYNSTLSKKVACPTNNSPSACGMKPIQTNRPIVSRYNNAILKDDANECVTNQTPQNSKWSQFLEDTQNDSSESATSSCCNNTQDESKITFSSLDDDDLDAVLEF